MSQTIQPGDRCILTRDIVVGDHLAFMGGDPVVVESIAPDQVRPDNKYVVYSPALQQRFLLTDADLRLATGAHPQVSEHVPQSTSPGDVFGEYTGAPGDVFAGHGPLPDYSAEDRVSRGAVADFRHSRAFLPSMAGCIALVAVVIIAVVVLSGGTKAPAGVPKGWKMYGAKNTLVWLPPDDTVGHFSDDLTRMASKLRQKGVEYSQLIQTVKRSVDSEVLFAVQTDASHQDFTSGVNISSQEMPDGITPDAMLDSGIAVQPESFVQVSKQVVTLGGRQVGQVEYEATTGTVKPEEVVFLVPGGMGVYVATFLCNQNNLNQLMPDFEKIASNIRPG